MSIVKIHQIDENDPRWTYHLEDRQGNVLERSEIAYEQLNVAKAFARIEHPNAFLLVMKLPP